MHQRAKEEIVRKVKAAVSEGAKLLFGEAEGGSIVASQPARDNGATTDAAFYNPVVLTDVKPGNAAYEEELFGPVFSIVPFPEDDIERAVELHNGNNYGLGGGVFSRDVAKAEKLAVERLDTAMVGINDFVRSDPSLPFGGIKGSGIGRECSWWGMREFMNVKTVLVREGAAKL